MINRHGLSDTDQPDIWTRLAADRDLSAMPQDDANRVLASARLAMVFARERLDAVVPGEWDCTLESLGLPISLDGNASQVTFKCRLQILGVIREAVGTGRSYVTASRAAFLAACMMFGIPCTFTGTNDDAPTSNPSFDVPPQPLNDAVAEVHETPAPNSSGSYSGMNFVKTRDGGRVG